MLGLEDYQSLLFTLKEDPEATAALLRLWSHLCNTETALIEAEEELKCYTNAIDRALARKSITS